jgi:hypothetical protein
MGVAAVGLGLIAVAQLALVAAAALRLIDPGWEAAGIVGMLAGVGMVLTVLTVMLPIPADGPIRTLAGLAGLAAGVVVIATWATLLGRAFLTSDSVRIGLVVAADSVFALSLIVLYRTMKGDRPYPLRALAGLGSLRAVLEWIVFVMLASIGVRPIFRPGRRRGFHGRSRRDRRMGARAGLVDVRPVRRRPKLLRFRVGLRRRSILNTAAYVIRHVGIAIGSLVAGWLVVSLLGLGLAGVLLGGLIYREIVSRERLRERRG